MAFARRLDHSSVILSCNLIGQRESKSFYVTEIVLRLGYADVIFRRRESRQPEIRLRSQAKLCGTRCERHGIFISYSTVDIFEPRISESPHTWKVLHSTAVGRTQKFFLRLFRLHNAYSLIHRLDQRNVFPCP